MFARRPRTAYSGWLTSPTGRPRPRPPGPWPRRRQWATAPLGKWSPLGGWGWCPRSPASGRSAGRRCWCDPWTYYQKGGNEQDQHFLQQRWVCHRLLKGELLPPSRFLSHLLTSAQRWNPTLSDALQSDPPYVRLSMLHFCRRLSGKSLHGAQH